MVNVRGGGTVRIEYLTWMSKEEVLKRIAKVELIAVGSELATEAAADRIESSSGVQWIGLFLNSMGVVM